MKSALSRYLNCFLIIATLSGCEKEVKHIKLPQFEQKLVIASFISPSDSVSYVLVSSNRRLYGELNDEESPGNLTGTISDGSNMISLDTTSKGLKFNRGKMQIQYRKTYTLKVTSDKGISAEAVCTVPEKREFLIQSDTSSVLHQEPGYLAWREFRSNISFIDFPGEFNYYRLAGELFYYKTDPETEILEINRSPIRFTKAYFTDKDSESDNKIHTSISIKSFNKYDSAFVKIFLLNTEKSYYLYHKSLEDYNSGEDPFSEVTSVYSNINGGLGIFTSYTLDSLIYRIK